VYRVRACARIKQRGRHTLLTYKQARYIFSHGRPSQQQHTKLYNIMRRCPVGCGWMRVVHAAAGWRWCNGYTEILPPSPLGVMHIFFSSCLLLFNCYTPRVYYCQLSFFILLLMPYCEYVGEWVDVCREGIYSAVQVCAGWTDGLSWRAETLAISSLSRNYVDGSTLII